MKFPPWTSVSEAARLLKDGEVVAIPTDTVYIFRDKNTIPQNIMEMGFDTKDFGSIRVYYNTNY